MITVDENIRRGIEISQIETKLKDFAERSNLKCIVRWNDICQLWVFEFLNTNQKTGCRYSLTTDELLIYPVDKLCDSIVAAVMKTKVI